MGKIRSDMAKLVEQIRGSMGARRSRLSEIHKGACGLLGRDQRERRERARSLREQACALGTALDQQDSQRRRAAMLFRQMLDRTAEVRRAAFRATCMNSRNRLRQLHLERAQTSRAVKAQVGREVADTREAVAALKSAVQNTMRSIGADVKEAERLWRRGLSKRPARRT